MKMLISIILHLDDVNNLVDMSPLHMPLPMLTACMQVKDNDGSIFVVSSLKDQSPILFGRVQYRNTTSNEDLKPPQFFHYSRSAHLMMKEMGYDLRMVKA